MRLTENLGTADKVIRLIVSAVIVVLFVTNLIGGPLAAGLLSLAVVLALTGLFSFCPLYKLLGIENGKKR